MKPDWVIKIGVSGKECIVLHKGHRVKNITSLDISVTADAVTKVKLEFVGNVEVEALPDEVTSVHLDREAVWK